MARPVSKVSKVRVAGPLAPFAEGFASRLRDLGYTPLSAVNQLRLAAQLSGWLEAGGFSSADLSDVRVEEFLAARRASGYTGLISRRGLTPLLDFLAARGQLPPAVPVEAPASRSEQVLATFHGYLLRERGLASSTADAYVLRARRFMADCAPNGHLAEVSTADITRAVLDVSATLSVGSAQMFVAALRSFLRFAHVEGLAEADLSAAALTVTGRRASSLPRSISPAQADALLASCDRRRAIGRRDYAVLVVLLRLGLRAGEVAALSLDDIDWRAGEVVVHGKGRRDERLPLPNDVGEAIVGYLRRGRPTTTRREVFVSAIAPIGPLDRGAVSSIVRRACQRAGVPAVGAHRLRHTLACQMVQAGVPLPEIGQVLRHRSAVSTAVYARIDVDGLRTLAQPWPGGSPS
jgi:integrase/recombinase XerD